MQKVITVADALALVKKVGSNRICRADTARARKNTKAQYPTVYIDNVPTPETGLSTESMLVKVSSIMLCSAVRPRATNEEKEQDKAPKNVQMMVHKLKLEDLELTDYNTDQRAKLVHSTNEFVELLELLVQVFKCQIIPEQFTAEFLTSQKLPAKEIREISTIAQYERNDKDNQKVPLETPLYRLQIQVDAATKRIGRTIKTDKGDKFSFSLYDVRKKPAAEATLKSGSSIVPITYENVHRFATKYSVATFSFRIEYSIAKKWFSQTGRVVPPIYIAPHRVIKAQVISNEELDAMATMNTGKFDDNIEDDEEEVKPTKHSAVDEEEDQLAAPDEPDEAEPTDEPAEPDEPAEETELPDEPAEPEEPEEPEPVVIPTKKVVKTVKVVKTAKK